jgi:hypothetical protein
MLPWLSLQTCRRHYPGGTVQPRHSCLSPKARKRVLHSDGLPRSLAGRLPHRYFSGPARRSLTLRPACSRDRLCGPFHRRLRRFRYLHRRSDCFRLERQVAGRACTRWKTKAFMAHKGINTTPVRLKRAHSSAILVVSFVGPARTASSAGLSRRTPDRGVAQPG